MESYKDYCKQFIEDYLQDFEGVEFESGHELASELTMGINIDGSATYSTWEAKEYIKEWWDECAAFNQDYEDIYGMKPQHDPFDSPELYHCLMVIVGVEKELQELQVSAKMEERFELTEKLIKEIIEEL